MADRLDRFWSVLENGVDCIRPLPESRRADVEAMLAALGIPPEAASIPEAAYLDAVDRFDCSFFRLSPKEASLMDPNQRLFLETAWGAIEDAGYGGKQLVGSRTGVFVGYGSDPDYKRWVASVDSSLLSTALAGNTRPIIASRLSYLLDLKGPSLIVDTTCSSSLMAVHLACRSIREGECDMAIAGGVQLHLAPVRQTNIGIEAADFRAKSFDESADGTGTGEGVAAIVLKPLDLALRDGDSVYAVVKGSAANHDGMSIGITAPNAAAQEDVIVRAWQDAGVEAESIAYIEAHGTGTKLGDPIEAEGLQRAFSRFTEKSQFCAIGSVKSNIGHLDNSAGIAGVVKAVLALRHKKIPPSLHVLEPNRNIDFVRSPLYVNDRLAEWEAGETPRRCGVSSFGLSGTNCHLVLEEASSAEEGREAENDGAGPHLLALSARSERALLALADSYLERLDDDPGIRLADLCYTANTGRGHYAVRAALLFRTGEELADRLKRLKSHLSKAKGREGDSPEGIFFGVRRTVSAGRPVLSAEEMTEHEAQSLSRLAEQWMEERAGDDLPERLARLYAEGASPDWSLLYRGQERRRLHLPAYPFEPTRCWLEPARGGNRQGGERSVAATAGADEAQADGSRSAAALLDRLVVSTTGVEVYATQWDASRDWVLSEHKIRGDSVLVGTAYLEMAVEACRLRFPGRRAALREVVFLAPLTVKPGEPARTVLVLTDRDGAVEFAVESRPADSEGDESAPVRHVQGRIDLADPAAPPAEEAAAFPDPNELRERLKAGYRVPDLARYNETSAFEFGPRWNNIESMYVGEGELLTVISMPGEYRQELDGYTLYPPLMDNALATMPLIERAIAVDSRTDEAIFLPYSYRTLRIFRPLPARFYSYVKLKDEITPLSEWIRYDIDLVGESGEPIARIEDYALKKARKRTLDADRRQPGMLHEITWLPAPLPVPSVAAQGAVLVIGSEQERTEELVRSLRRLDRETIRVAADEIFGRANDAGNSFLGDEEGLRRLLEELKDRDIRQIVYEIGPEAEKPDQWERTEPPHGNDADAVGAEVGGVFRLVRSLLGHSLRQPVELAIVSTGACRVVGEETRLHPGSAAAIGLTKVIGSEYPHLPTRAVDTDEETPPELVARELASERPASGVAAYRRSVRYLEQLRELSAPPKPESAPGPLPPSGHYLITGGTGGIGLEIARWLASRHPVRLVLVGRSPVPDRERWEEIVRGEGERSPKTARTARAVVELEASGSEVLWLSADAADRERMAEAIRRARERFGRIDVVVHSAGLPGSGFFIRKEPDEFREVYEAKAKGAVLLDELTREDRPDRFVLFSSNDTLIGIPGQSDYAAANSFLDAYSAYRNLRTPGTVTINWPAWLETGMAADHGTNKDSLLKAIPTARALEAFEAALRSGADRVVVGELHAAGELNGMTWADFPIPLSPGLRRKISIAGGGAPAARGESAASRAARSKAASRDESREEIEAAVSGVWRDVLGYEDVNVYDSFFEIGGDSIQITRVHGLLEERFPGLTTVADLFTYPTIAAISQYIEGELASRSGSEGDGIRSPLRAAFQDSHRDPHQEPLQDSYRGLFRDEAAAASAADRDDDPGSGIDGLLDAFVRGEIDIEQAVEAYERLGVIK